MMEVASICLVKQSDKIRKIEILHVGTNSGHLLEGKVYWWKFYYFYLIYSGKKSSDIHILPKKRSNFGNEKTINRCPQN